MPRTLSRPSLIILLVAIGTTPATAVPTHPHSVVTGSIAQIAKTQCYMKDICVHWLRPKKAPSEGYWGGHKKCGEWVTKKVCEPHVYNTPNKPADGLPRVRVPKLIGKPKPWHFQRQPSFKLPPSLGRSSNIMRR